MADDIRDIVTNVSDVPARPEYMLTTYDNPFDPFTEWDQWYSWDLNAGYHTPGLLARMTFMSNELSEADQHVIIQEAIDDIVKANLSGVHMKVTRDTVKRLISTTTPLPQEG